VRVFRYPITTESLAKQITKISRFTSINDRTNRVPINQLLVNNLLPDRPSTQKSDRPNQHKNPAVETQKTRRLKPRLQKQNPPSRVEDCVIS